VLVLGVSSLVLVGCPGDLDPRLMGSGTGGTGGTGGPQVCDAATLMKNQCGMAGCHSATVPQAALDLASPGVIARLLGQPGNPTANPACAGNTKALLVDGSTTGDGFLIDKLNNPAPCGTFMPQIPGPLNAGDLQCMKEWATAVTTHQIQ
jgi:hypothetical protein